MPRIGVVTTLPGTKRVVAFAQAAEAFGFDRVGMADTAPKLYHAVYPAVTAALLKTERISIGTYVTNPVTRHWSVHAGTARALEELALGRFFLGMATGDGAVHSVGQKPAKLEYLESYVKDMRPLMPETTNVHMAFSGAKGVEVAGRVANELTIATGLDAGAIKSMTKRALATRTAAGVNAPLKTWGLAPIVMVETESEVNAMRKYVRGFANGISRFSFDFSFDGKNVPEDIQPILKEGLSRYDFAFHGKAGDHTNAHLFDKHPDVQEYLLDRMLIVGTAKQCLKRLEDIFGSTELEGFWLTVTPTTDKVADHIAELTTIAGGMKAFLA